METDYRPSVLAVFTNDQGLVLVAVRRRPKGAWQFPQGGIDPGETPEAAVAREMREELGCGGVIIVGRGEEPVRYDFPPGMTAPVAKHFRGQAQVWFHLKVAPGAEVDLSKATDDEFSEVAWVTPEEALARVVDFKYASYERGLTMLGLLKRKG